MGGPAPSLHRESTDSLILRMKCHFALSLPLCPFFTRSLTHIINISVESRHVVGRAALGGAPVGKAEVRVGALQKFLHRVQSEVLQQFVYSSH